MVHEIPTDAHAVGGAALDEDDVAFVVVRNDAGQYSVWWEDSPPPAGWTADGAPASRADCLDRIALLWTDLRPPGLTARIEGEAP